MTDKGGERPASPAGGVRGRFERVYAALRERIILLDYGPGERLSEEVLAAEFGVSRTPIRRVLARLESEGLLRSVHGVGTMVTDVRIAELNQVYSLRMELATLIGRLAPKLPDAAGLAVFRALLARGDGLVDSPDAREFARLNADFFHALSTLTDNEPLREISERLYYRTTRIWLKSLARMNLPEEIVIFRREIADVVEALEIGDIEAVGHIRRWHISMSFHRLRGYDPDGDVTGS